MDTDNTKTLEEPADSQQLDIPKDTPVNLNAEIKKLESEQEFVKSELFVLDKKLEKEDITNEEHAEEVGKLLNGKARDEVLGAKEGRIAQLKVEAKGLRAKKKNSMITSGTAAAIILLGIFAFMTTSPGGLTGFAVAGEPIEQTYQFNQEFSTNSETTLDYTGILGLKVSGSINGPGAAVKLRTADREYLVANIAGSSSKTYTLTTGKKTYQLGEAIDIILTPQPESVSLYVQHNEENNIINTYSYTPNDTGGYNIVAVITTQNDILRLEVSVNVTNETPGESVGDIALATENAALNTFTSLCEESCLLQSESTNPILVVELQAGTTLKISEVTTLEQGVNNPPIQTKTFSDITLKTGDSLSYRLADYFTEPDGTALQYDVTLINGLGTNLAGDLLTITGSQPGEYLAHVYASDGANIVTGNDFKILVGDNETTTPGGGALPPVESNQTNGTTIIQPPDLTDCNDPNPNKRPLYCIEGQEGKYFAATPIYLEDTNKQEVGRVTTFGNLFIKGKLVENTQSSPSGGDFRISYLGPGGESEITNAWISTETGDLHLRGKLFEEQIDLVPPNFEAFLIQNKKGTTLGYFERYSGNLYLRGNLIQEKPGLE